MKENQIERMKNYIKFIESKMFTGKNLRMTQKKASRADLTKKKPDVVFQKQMRAWSLNTKSFYHSFIGII